MGRLFFMVVGLVVGGGAIFTAFNYHVVKSSGGFELVPKKEIGLHEVYVDVRAFSVADWVKNPGLAADIVAADKSHLLGEAGGQTIGQGVQSFIEGWQR